MSLYRQADSRTADYKKEYPQAKLIGNEAVAQAEAKKDLVFDGGEYIN
jgi:hypothetical protein